MAQIPCIVRYPQRLEPVRVKKLARSIDIVPTVLALLDDDEHILSANPQLEGTPLTRVDASTKPIEAYCETFDLGAGRRKSALRQDNGEHKWRYHREQGTLFDLATDPGEQKNIATPFPARSAYLRGRIDDYQAKRDADSQKQKLHSMGEEEKKIVGSLKALGYL